MKKLTQKTTQKTMLKIRQSLKTLLAAMLLVGLSLPLQAFDKSKDNTDLTNEATNKKILMVVSGYGQKDGEERPGYEFDEFSKAYTVFKENGIDVDVASPKGGGVEADEFDENKPYNLPVLADNSIMSKLNDTLKTANLEASHYDAIFIVGGKGAMFDLPKDKALQALIADVYQQSGSIAAVCHGPAALIDVKLSDGSYLVANKAINGFTNKEEQLFGKKWLAKFEFMLEDKLIERGGKFQSSEIMLSHVAVDGRLITGQNPTSTVDVATELVKSLKIKPGKTRYDIEDRTMAVVAKFLAGDKSALAILSKDPEQYHVALAGMYGFYYLKGVEKDSQLEQALSLMLVAQDVINNPVLDMNIAKTQHKLGKTQDAKGTLEQLLSVKPEYEPAKEMLNQLSI